MSSGNPILLEDLLIEIFLRSSVKSLLRAKCVCKHWYGLIKNHTFEHKYLDYQKDRKQNRLLLQYFNNETQEFNYTILDDINQSSSTHHPLEYLRVIHHIQKMEGPVNGVYCFYVIKDRIVLWNPALRDFKILPSPPPHLLPHYEVAGGDVGFGIDPLTNDHKVVLFRDFVDAIEDIPVYYKNPVVTLYNLTTNSWRPLDLGDLNLQDYKLSINTSSSFINGTYHWWVRSGVVLAFNFGNETFRVIPGPDISEFDGVEYHGSKVAVYKEHVALVCHYESLLNIWLMLEEGIWIKQFSIGPLPGLVWSVGFWKNEGIFIVINDSEPIFYNPNSQLVLYDVNSREMTNLGPKAIDYGFQVCVYHESLISFNGGSKYDRDIISDLLDE